MFTKYKTVAALLAMEEAGAVINWGGCPRIPSMITTVDDAWKFGIGENFG